MNIVPFSKEKLNKAIEEEIKNHDSELEMKRSVASVYISDVRKIENDVWKAKDWYKVEDIILDYFSNNYKKIQVELVFRYIVKKSSGLDDDNVVEIHPKRDCSGRTPAGFASKKKIFFLQSPQILVLDHYRYTCEGSERARGTWIISLCYGTDENLSI